MPKLSVRGVDHYYEWICEPAGSPETDRHNRSTTPNGIDRPVIVFLHGWGGSARYWESTARSLANQFDCLLYDLRGFGRSTVLERESSSRRADQQSVFPLDYEMASYAEDLGVLLDSLQLKQVYLSAHSMGASIATVFLNRYPERVRQAVLTCSGIFDYDEKAFKAFHRFGRYVVRFRPAWLRHLPSIDQLFMARFLHRPIPRTASRAFLEDFLMADRTAALGTMLTSVSQAAAETLPQEFANLSVPTLLIAGEYDRIIPAEMGRQAAQLNHQIEFALIPNTGHFPMLEDPTIYLEQVLAFLGTLQPTAPREYLQ